MNIKKSFILIAVMLVLAGLTGCGNKPEEIIKDQKPDFKAGWYIYEGMTTRYFLYYKSAEEIMFGGIYEQQYEDTTLDMLNKNYKYDDAWENLYYLDGKKITNKLNGKDESIDSFEENHPDWFSRDIVYSDGDDKGIIFELYIFADREYYKRAIEWWYRDSREE